MSIPLTPIVQLAAYYSDIFELTILSERIAQQLSLYKPTVSPVTCQDEVIQPIVPIIKIGSKWSHKERPFQIIVQDISQSPYGDVVWIVDSNQPSHTSECVVIHQFLDTYEQVPNEEFSKFTWNKHCIHENGVLCKHILTNEINILDKFSIYFDEFIPLTKTEAMNLIYNDDDVISF